MPQVRVNFKPNGQIRVDAEGFSGEGCRNATAKIVERLRQGQDVVDTPKPEAFEATHEGTVDAQQG